jgi:hypothetical protein
MQKSLALRIWASSFQLSHPCNMWRSQSLALYNSLQLDTPDYSFPPALRQHGGKH